MMIRPAHAFSIIIFVGFFCMVPGCYLSHDHDDPPLASDVYVRRDCGLCAIPSEHLSWLRRCDDHLYLDEGYGRVRAVFALRPGEGVELVSCAIDESFGPMCVACDELDVRSVLELLSTTTIHRPQGEAGTFFPYREAGFPYEDPPSCEALIAEAPLCD